MSKQVVTAEDIRKARQAFHTACEREAAAREFLKSLDETSVFHRLAMRVLTVHMLETGKAQAEMHALMFDERE